MWSIVINRLLLSAELCHVYMYSYGRNRNPQFSEYVTAIQAVLPADALHVSAAADYARVARDCGHFNWSVLSSLRGFTLADHRSRFSK